MNEFGPAMNRKALSVFLLMVWLSLPGFSGLAYAQSPESEADSGTASESETDADNDAGEADDDEEEDEKTIEEILEDSTLHEGLFRLYRDTKTGELRMLLEADQLDQTYLYFVYTENGVTAADHYRGSFGLDQAKAFRISRFFDRLEFIVENSAFWFEPGTAIARAADANISHAVAADIKIESEDEATGRLLIKADSLFLTEAFNAIAPLPNPTQPAHEGFRLGSLDSARTKVREIRNYPQNTDVLVEYVYKNDQPYVSGGEEVTDPRAISITVQHSLLAPPDNGYQARFDDPRVGYFTNRVTDLSSTGVIPYRDLIHRWHLEKADPDAPVSDPVEPIVYWIENTTPVELRPVIEAAALRWNEAFEAAGISNAIEVRIQPDDASWDAGDIRYNVIRWTSSPNPPFGGYGPSFADPRTGEILGADIMIEYSVITGNLRQATVFGEALALDAGIEDDPYRCEAGLLAHREMLFAAAALEGLGADSEEKQRLLEEYIHFLVLHEIGHTLGLNHNFRASHFHDLESVFDPELTYPVGLQGSVMDYPVVPFALAGEEHGQFYTTRPGPYDHWAINFGYSRGLADAAAEQERLDTLLSRSTEPELAFGNDADDMRSAGKAIDPRAMLYDLTSDPIGFAAHQLATIESVVASFDERLLRDGESYQELLNGFQLAASRYRSAARVASRYIGGVYVDRAMVDQPGATTPLTPVSLEDQLRAMQLLSETIFSPAAFSALHDSASQLLPQRRGFDHYSTTEDPKLHATALTIQSDILSHLLHPRVLTRLTDTRIYGNEYSVAAMLGDLTDAVFAADIDGDVNTFRQNLQIEYTNRLLAILEPGSSDYDHLARTMALDRLRWIESALERNRRGNDETRAHRAHILYRIDSELNGDD